MKPLKGDQQLRSVSLSYSVALQALKPNPLSKKKGRRGLDASTDRGLTERSGEVFSLDILSHRMSDAIFRQLSLGKDFSMVMASRAEMTANGRVTISSLM